MISHGGLWNEIQAARKSMHAQISADMKISKNIKIVHICSLVGSYEIMINLALVTKK